MRSVAQDKILAQYGTVLHNPGHFHDHDHRVDSGQEQWDHDHLTDVGRK